MPGISAIATNIPRYRLPREVIARAWGGTSMGGERTVANHDEDSLTLAVGAALELGAAAAGAGAVYFATTSAPYAEKQGAATLAAVLDAAPNARTLDFTDSQRAATSALLAGLDALEAGTAERVVVASGECRTGEPESQGEQGYGDAGAALVLAREGAALADVVAVHSVHDEFLGTWRTSEQRFPKSMPTGFDAKLGYARVLGTAIQGVLHAAGATAADVRHLVLPTPSPRAPQGLAKGLGFDPKTQLQDGLWAQVGDCGAAQPLVLLAAALERAKPGELVLVAAYGDGADALLLSVNATAQARLARQIEVKRPLQSYARYARFRGLVARESGATDASSPAITFRDRAQVLGLEGGRCKACGAVQFPRHRHCIECSDGQGLDAVRLARRGTLFTFTVDHMHESLDPPVAHGVVDLEAGGRIYLQLTDCDPDTLAIDMPLELTFRRLHDAGGFHNYFWKARPA
jgi:3-hydroxy-3-methylglutaryl CoA synthase